MLLEYTKSKNRSADIAELYEKLEEIMPEVEEYIEIYNELIKDANQRARFGEWVKMSLQLPI